MKDFHEIMSEINGKDNVHILLGNGFSRGHCEICDNKFSYENITPKISERLKENAGRLKAHLNQSDNANVESILCDFEYGSQSIPNLNDYLHLEDPKGIADSISEDRQLLWEYFFSVFEALHPIYDHSDVTKYKICNQNLTTFKNIFTLNYDLLLYWVINSEEFKKHRDAFSRKFPSLFKEKNRDFIEKGNLLRWSNANNQISIHYLHGAVHLLQLYGEVCKFSRSDQKSLTLQEIIKEYKTFSYVNNFQKPIVVLEGTHESKEKSIFNSPYLCEVYDRFLRISGDVVIYGCSIVKPNGELNNDKHLWNHLFRNEKVDQIYIGINCADELEAEDKMSEKRDAISSIFPNSRLIFYRITQNQNLWSARENH